ncbi:MAG: type II secretion system F family protein [Planctomycetota bacterium]|nr:type II secretion system F family protein [Planctomycetota bacterium]
MAVFEYNAVDLDASAVGGTVMADSPRQARDLLRARGLTVTNLHALERADTLSFRQRRRGKSAQYQVVAFVRELATLSAAGIPLLSALHTLAEQHRGHFRTVIEVLADAVASGTSLAEAMERHPEYFDELCHNVVQVGESTGGLEQALRRLAEFKEKAHRLRSRVITALIYPAIVGTVGLAVAVFMMTFVVPNLLSTLANAGRPLPWVTQVVKSCSELLVRWWWALLLGAGAAGAGLRLIWRSPPGRLAVDRLVLRVPIIGELITKETTSRMAVVMAALLRSGLDFVQAYDANIKHSGSGLSVGGDIVPAGGAADGRAGTAADRAAGGGDRVHCVRDDSTHSGDKQCVVDLRRQRRGGSPWSR